MAIEDIVARGVGFSPGGVNFIVTHGFIAGEVVEILAGRGGKRVYILPDGRRVNATRQEAEQLVRDHFTPEPLPPPVVIEPELPVLASGLPELLNVQMPELASMQVPRPTQIQPLNLRIPRDDEQAIIALLLN